MKIAREQQPLVLVAGLERGLLGIDDAIQFPEAVVGDADRQAARS